MLMYPCGYAVMRMSLWCMQWCECNLVGMQWCRCPFRYAMNANAPLWVYHDTNALMQTQFIQKFLLFSKRGFHNAWNQNIFKLNLLFLKSHLPFDLRLPKNWWSLLENLRIGHRLGIWWSGSKDSQFGWAKGVAHFRGLFLEKWILWKSSILKRFIFLVSEYSNLTGIKTHLW